LNIYGQSIYFICITFADEIFLLVGVIVLLRCLSQ
jgi:hypothetical protein